MLYEFESIVYFWEFDFLRRYPEYLDSLTKYESFAVKALLAMAED